MLRVTIRPAMGLRGDLFKDAAEGLGEFAPGAVAAHGIFLKRAGHDVLNEGRKVGADRRQAERRCMGDRIEQGGEIVGPEGRVAGQKFEHHDAERIDIGSPVHFFPGDLFR